MAMPEGTQRSTAINGGQLQQATSADDWSDAVILCGDCIEVMSGMDAKSVNTCVTSPPYFGLRDYGCDGQIGLESTVDEYVAKMVEVFSEVRRVLRDDGTLWLNLGDSYASNPASGGPGKQWEGSNQRTPMDRTYTRPTGLKPKDLIGIPWRVAFALQADGWWLRQDIIWHKPNPMPESVTDRCTKAHEYLFLLSKSARYYYDADAIAEASKYPHDDRKSRSAEGHKRLVGGRVSGIQEGSATYPTRNKRSVWTVTTKTYKGAHFATFPPDLIEPCILAGCPDGGTVLDPFLGSGTTIMVAEKNGRIGVGIELNEEYIKIAENRVADSQPLWAAQQEGEA
jgi:DNA modification methylase